MTLHPDDAALMRRAEAMRRLKDEINATDYEDDADLNAACAPLQEMESEFIRMPVGTIAGLLVKLEVAFAEIVGSLAPDLDTIYGELSGQAHLRAALEDARRLVATG